MFQNEIEILPNHREIPPPPRTRIKKISNNYFDKKRTRIYIFPPTKIMDVLMEFHLHELHTSFCSVKSLFQIIQKSKLTLMHPVEDHKKGLIQNTIQLVIP